MPQLDTTYTLTIYLWTWLMIYLMTKKIKTFMMLTPQKQQTTKTQTPPMPWP